MKSCMRQMTLVDMKGHWRSIDGRCYLVIDKDNSRVNLFVNQSLYVDEPLSFEYIDKDEERNLCNVWVISQSIILFMLSPQDGNIILKINDDKVEFTR